MGNDEGENRLEEIEIGGKPHRRVPTIPIQSTVSVSSNCSSLPGIARAEPTFANYHRFSSLYPPHNNFAMLSTPVILISVGVVSLVPARFLALHVYHPASPFWIPEITRFPFPTIWNLFAEVRSRNWPSLIHLETS